MDSLQVRLYGLRVRVWLRTVSPAWPLVLVSLPLLLWVHCVWLPSRAGQLADMEREVSRLRNQSRTFAQARPATPKRTDMQRIDDLESTLGEVDRVQQHMRTLFGLAQPLGLALEQGQYAIRCDTGTPYCHYKVLLPVKAPYPVVRLFVAQVLSALPFSSVDEWSMRRDAVSDDEFDGRIAVTLHVRDTGAAGLASARGRAEESR